MVRAFSPRRPRSRLSSEPEDLQDIDGHLRGGIPTRDIDTLARYWQVFPSLRATLFKKADRPGSSKHKVAAPDIKAAIFGHQEFTSFSQSVTKLFEKWKQRHRPRLTAIRPGDHPKALIEILSEDMLDGFQKAPLLDPYDVYQHNLPNHKPADRIQANCW